MLEKKWLRGGSPEDVGVYPDGLRGAWVGVADLTAGSREEGGGEEDVDVRREDEEDRDDDGVEMGLKLVIKCTYHRDQTGP
ncbi:hypothetical protein HK104_010769 [Borealophlyctis nickersoniae]|nr:hypothetical protein HK104_010769 [Borealophlyctis nickersoniae]